MKSKLEKIKALVEVCGIALQIIAFKLKRTPNTAGEGAAKPYPPPACSQEHRP